MNKILKRTISAAAALTLTVGAVPFADGGYDLTAPAVTANAEVLKPLEPGVKYNIGETLYAAENAYVLIDDSDEYDVTQIAAGKYKVGTPKFSSEYSQYVFEDVFAGDDLWLGWGKGFKGKEDIGGFVCTGGSGTFYDPYVFDIALKTQEVLLANASVALDRSITLRFYAESIDAELTSATLEGPNGTMEYTYPFPGDENGFMVFSYPLYATQLDEEVSISFSSGDEPVDISAGGNSYSAFTYTVNDYCDHVLDPDNGFYSMDVNAVRALKNLGLAADNYFEGKNAEIDFISDDKDPDYLYEDEIAGYASEFAPEDAKLSLVLDSMLAARLYIKGLTAGDVSDDGEYTAVSGSGGKACFEVKNILPDSLGDDQSISYNGKDYRFSALSYSLRAYLSNDKKTEDVGQAVFEYCKYVKIFVSSLSAKSVSIYSSSDPEPELLEEIVYYPGMTWTELARENNNINITGSGLVMYGTAYLHCEDTNGAREVKAEDEIDDLLNYYTV